MTSGQIRLWPEQAKPGGPPVEPIGAIGSDGSYKIQTNGKPGAPLGKYKVTVSVLSGGGDSAAEADPANMKAGATGGPKEQAKPYNPRFESPSDTPLTIDVTASPSPGAYDLKLTR